MVGVVRAEEANFHKHLVEARHRSQGETWVVVHCLANQAEDSHSTAIATIVPKGPIRYLDIQQTVGPLVHLVPWWVVVDLEVCQGVGPEAAHGDRQIRSHCDLGSLRDLLAVGTFHRVAVVQSRDSMNGVVVVGSRIDRVAIPCTLLEDPWVHRLVHRTVPVDIVLGGLGGRFHDKRLAAVGPPLALPLCAASSLDQAVLKT